MPVEMQAQLPQNGQRCYVWRINSGFDEMIRPDMECGLDLKSRNEW